MDESYYFANLKKTQNTTPDLSGHFPKIKLNLYLLKIILSVNHSPFSKFNFKKSVSNWNVIYHSCHTCLPEKLLSTTYLLDLILEASGHCKMHLFLSCQCTFCLLHNCIQFQIPSESRKNESFSLFSWCRNTDLA